MNISIELEFFNSKYSTTIVSNGDKNELEKYIKKAVDFFPSYINAEVSMQGSYPQINILQNPQLLRNMYIIVDGQKFIINPLSGASTTINTDVTGANSTAQNNEIKAQLKAEKGVFDLLLNANPTGTATEPYQTAINYAFYPFSMWYSDKDSVWQNAGNSDKEWYPNRYQDPFQGFSDWKVENAVALGINVSAMKSFVTALKTGLVSFLTTQPDLLLQEDTAMNCLINPLIEELIRVGYNSGTLIIFDVLVSPYQSLNAWKSANSSVSIEHITLFTKLLQESLERAFIIDGSILFKNAPNDNSLLKTIIQNYLTQIESKL